MMGFAAPLLLPRSVEVSHKQRTQVRNSAVPGLTSCLLNRERKPGAAMVGLGSTSQKEKAELCLNPALCRKPSKIPAQTIPCSSTLTRGSRNPLQIHTLDVPKGPEPALAKSMEHLHPRAAGARLEGCRTRTKVNFGEIKGTLQVSRTSKPPVTKSFMPQAHPPQALLLISCPPRALCSSRSLNSLTRVRPFLQPTAFHLPNPAPAAPLLHQEI